MKKLFRTMFLVAALAYAMSLLLPAGADASTGHLAVAPKRVIAGGMLTVKATATTPTGCQLALNAPSGAETAKSFRPERHDLTWKLKVAKTAAAGHWTISVICDGVGPTSSTSFSVAGHGRSTKIGTIGAPAQTGGAFANKTVSATSGAVRKPVITWRSVVSNGMTRQQSVQIDFAGSAGASFQCQVDNGSFSACASPFRTPDLADGSHFFRVRAIDGSGAVSAAVVAHWTTDHTFNPMDRGQCTEGAYSYRPDIFDASTSQSGDWSGYTWAAHARAAGYIVDHNAEVGDIAVWPQNWQGTGSAGHVAYVTAVGDGTITVSETGGSYGSTPHENTYSSDGLWFIHKHA